MALRLYFFDLSAGQKGGQAMRRESGSAYFRIMALEIEIGEMLQTCHRSHGVSLIFLNSTWRFLSSSFFESGSARGRGSSGRPRGKGRAGRRQLTDKAEIFGFLLLADRAERRTVRHVAWWRGFQKSAPGIPRRNEGV